MFFDFGRYGTEQRQNHKVGISRDDGALLYRPTPNNTHLFNQ
jgi:hypothetical protein